MSRLPRRVYARYPCDLPMLVYSPVTQAKLADARLLDLGMGGGSVACELTLQPGVSYEFRLAWRQERLALLGRVAWSARTAGQARRAAPKRYGVSFNLTTQQEALLRSLVERLRQDHPAKQPDHRFGTSWLS